MSTEEKLQHFLDICMEDAREKSARILDEYTASLDKSFQEHQADSQNRCRIQVNQESEKMKRELNKKLSIEQLNIKRILGSRQDELKDKLFVELRDMLAVFLETPEYQQLLEHQVAHAVEFAGEDEVVIYLDPVDEDKMHRLALHHGTADIRISEYSFTGGCRAVIPSRHILIDNSFQTKLSEAKANFHFDLDLKSGGEHR